MMKIHIASNMRMKSGEISQSKHRQTVSVRDVFLRNQERRPNTAL